MKTVLFPLAVLFLAACATVNTPEEVQIPTEGPQISPTLANQAQHTLKRKVVVARFTNESTYGKSVLLGDKKSLIGRTTSDMLSSRLAQSGQFLLFERADPETVLKAFEDNQLENLKLPADYLIVGSLAEFGRNTTGESGVFSRSKIQKAYARVNIRLIDVRTGLVIYAEEGTGEAETEAGTIMGVGSKAGYDSTLDSKAISAAISKLVSNVMENLLDRPWSSYVLYREDENLYIGGGKAQGISVGDRFSLIKPGKTVANPQTGLHMELPGTPVATLQVISLFGHSPEEEGSVCKVVSGTLPTGNEIMSYRVEEVNQ